MVKNDAGGNKGKGLARKHVNAAKCGGVKQLRVAIDEAEKYGVVSKMLGNGMCYVRILGSGSSGDKLCIIRNKFKGRGKRDNILDSGSWVLVGMREWASKQDTCDLLEVYNDGERDRLLKNEPCFKGVAESNATAATSTSNVQFADNNTMKYSKLVRSEAGKSEAGKGEDDDEDDAPLQQRNYDMPSSSDDSDSDSDLDSDPDSDPVITITTTTTTTSKVTSKVKVDHINVDDI